MENYCASVPLSTAWAVADLFNLPVEFIADEESEFVYLPETNTVVLGTVGPTTAHCAMAFFYKTFGIEVKPQNVARLALLHELGHAATWGGLDSTELFLEMLCKDDPELEFTAYWRLPSEWAANQWAAEKGRELGWW